MKLRMIWLVFVLTFLCSTAAAKGTVEAKIGETEYQTLQDAINAAETGSIIVLQKDVSPAFLTITGKNITISGNWKNITGSGTTEISGGAKVVFDHVSILSGTVSASGTSSVEMKDSRISAQVLLDNSTLNASGTSYTNASGTVIVAKNNSGLTINNCSFSANTGINGGALYLKESRATLTGNTISGNRANIGGGIYVDEGAALIVNSGKIFDNTADTAAADVFVAANASQVSLPSVTAWNRPIHRGSRFSLDGWYEDAAENRWSLTNARQGSGNIYVGDTVTVETAGHSLKAGFTAYDVLNVEIEWVDYTNRYGTRMETVEFTARDNAGNLLKYQTLDGSEGETASLTLSEANGWKGTISPLSPGLSASLHIDDITFDLTSGGNVIRTYVVDHNNPFLYVKVDRWPDEPAEKNQGPSAVSTVYLKNTYIIPVNFVKVWDDSNNKDGVRPEGLRLYLKYNTEELTPYRDSALSGVVHPPISLTADNDWKRTVYLLADDEKDYANIISTEDCPDSYVNTLYSRTSNSDGSIDITFINRHDLRVDPDAPEPVSDDKINYRIALKWTWNGNGNGELPHPKVTVLLRGDGKEMRRAEIAADAVQAITFSDLPKYRDNAKSALVNYTIQEIITDENWVRFPVTEARVGEIPAIVDYWYSLDGMGRYRVEYAQAEIKEDTAALSTVYGEITNRYERLQNTTKVVITKRWKDHQNENKVRPGSVMFGLFRSAAETDPAWTSTLSGGSTDGWWRGTIENLPIYDDSGQAIDYSAYIVKESYDNGTTWLKSGAEYAITAGEKTYTYNYSVVTQR